MPFTPRQFSPAQLLAVSFGGLIVAGTVLLSLPGAAAREQLSLLDAFFTSTSVVCVTGLIVVDTPNDLSIFTLLTLIICGGVGFVVLTELGRLRRTRRLSVHTRLVLTVSAALIVGTTLAILVLEHRNPRTLGDLAVPQGLLAALFQAVAPRTAGFNTLDIGSMTPATLFLLMVLMFIGAAPGGTGGGIKITTFSITVAALWATVRGAQDPTIFERRLPPDLVARAFFISLIAFLTLNGVAGLLLITEQRALFTDVRRADAMMYAARSSGKDRIQLEVVDKSPDLASPAVRVASDRRWGAPRQ